jgi:hypothetical protein
MGGITVQAVGMCPVLYLNKLFNSLSKKDIEIGWIMADLSLQAEKVLSRHELRERGLSVGDSKYKHYKKGAIFFLPPHLIYKWFYFKKTSNKNHSLSLRQTAKETQNFQWDTTYVS